VLLDAPNLLNLVVSSRKGGSSVQTWSHWKPSISSITLSTNGMCLHGMSKQALVRSLEIFNPTTLADTSEEKCFDSTPRLGIVVGKRVI
jgi:hypothetical protein